MIASQSQFKLFRDWKGNWHAICETCYSSIERHVLEKDKPSVVSVRNADMLGVDIWTLKMGEDEDKG